MSTAAPSVANDSGRPRSRRLHFLITAGPTYESIDSVRFIGNRSSGRMGIAIAEAVVAHGHTAHLLLGPNTAPPPIADPGVGLTVTRFVSTAALDGLLTRLYPGDGPEGVDVLIMAAAVADYRPVAVEPWRPGGASAEEVEEAVAIPAPGSPAAAGFKLPRSASGVRLLLESTPDLVAACAARRAAAGAGGRIVAFALEEPEVLMQRATAKMQRKGVDAIVANPLATMDAATIDGRLLWADGRLDVPPVSAGRSGLDKRAFADWLVGRLLAAQPIA